MPFGMVSGVGQRMFIIDGVVIVEGEGQFGGEFGASHCKQWDLVALLCESDALFPNDFGEDLLNVEYSGVRMIVDYCSTYPLHG